MDGSSNPLSMNACEAQRGYGSSIQYGHSTTWQEAFQHQEADTATHCHLGCCSHSVEIVEYIAMVGLRLQEKRVNLTSCQATISFEKHFRINSLLLYTAVASFGGCSMCTRSGGDGGTMHLIHFCHFGKTPGTLWHIVKYTGNCPVQDQRHSHL